MEPTVGKHNVKNGILAISRADMMYSASTDTPFTLPCSALTSELSENVDLRPLYDAYEIASSPKQVLFREDSPL